MNRTCGNMYARTAYDNRTMSHPHRRSDSCSMMEPRHCNNSCSVIEPRSCSNNCSVIEPRSCNNNCSVNEPRSCSNNCSANELRSCNNICNEIPLNNRKQLLCYINEVSFAVYETMLYLDTHPEDMEAFEFFHKHNEIRNEALEAYAKHYGPLTISTANGCNQNCWEWMNQPWPWEGGDC